MALVSSTMGTIFKTGIRADPAIVVVMKSPNTHNIAKLFLVNSICLTFTDHPGRIPGTGRLIDSMTPNLIASSQQKVISKSVDVPEPNLTIFGILSLVLNDSNSRGVVVARGSTW